MAFSLKNKKRELLTEKHPLHGEEESLKLPYLLGVALLLARVGDDLAQAEREALAELIYGLDLPEGRLEMILARVQAADEGILDEILLALAKREVRYAFVLDLFKAARADQVFQPEEREFITDIIEMMRLAPAETAFLNAFGEAAGANDLASANAAVQQAIGANLEPNIGHLQFFMPGFSYEEELAGFTLGAHETRVLTRAARVTGSICVNAGSRLVINGAVLKFQGAAQLMVDGGEVELKNSTLTALQGAGLPLVTISSSTPSFEATDCIFDGGGMVPLVATMAAKTTFSGCIFTRAFRKGGAIEKLDPKAGSFSAILNGMLAPPKEDQRQTPGAAIYASAPLFLNQCDFIQNISETGAGAVYAAGPCYLSACKFADCRSKGVGGALILHNAYKVNGATFERCSSQANGGAVYICGGGGNMEPVVTASLLEKCTFKHCTTNKSGGGIFVHEVTYTISECHFISCSAGESGGGVATHKRGQQKSGICGSVFDNSTAALGGGISVACCQTYYNDIPVCSCNTFNECRPQGYLLQELK